MKIAKRSRAVSLPIHAAESSSHVVRRLRTIPCLLMLCFGLSLLPACNSNTPAVIKNESVDPDDTKNAADGAATPEASAAGEMKVYGKVPQFELTDQSGGKFASQKLDGKVWVANFFFCRCKSTCPEQSRQVAKLQKIDNVQLVSVSVEPEYDTPEALQQYAENYGAEPSRWHFLTGERDAIWDLSKKGFFLPVGEAPPEESMPIFHSAKLILVDGERQIRGFYESQDSDEMIQLRKDVERLLVAANPATSTDDAESDQELADLESKVEGAFAKLATKNPNNIFVPSKEDVFPGWMDERAAKQKKMVAESKVFHDFQFVDRQPDSGIDFMNQVVEDAGKNYTAAHYDHGNGVAIADIDNDGLFDIYFTNQIGSNGLYRNLGDGKFKNITDAAGVGLADRISVTSSFADVDNDGDADLYVTTVRGGNVMYLNRGDGTFEDVTESMGLTYNGHSSGIVFFDYDKDGFLDLFVTNVGSYTTEQVGTGNYYRSLSTAFSGHLNKYLTERSILYRNLDGKKFEDVSESTKLSDTSWSGDASPIDVNGDGWIDLYVLDMQGHDEYFENVEGKEFVNRRAEVFPKTPWGAMGIKAFDFDNDGDMDIYITDMHSDMSQVVGLEKEKDKAEMLWPESMLQSGGNSIYGNAFFENRDGKYVEVSDAIGAENFWPWGLSTGDLNADGFEDAFVVSSMNLPLRYGVNSLLLNENGKRFVDAEFAVGVEPRRDGMTAKPWYELDCDGEDKEHKEAKKAGITSGKVTVWGALGSRSSVIFDYDNDGDLDIITNDFHSEPMVLESDLASKKEINYLKIHLVGSKSNRDGLGAKVEVTLPDGSKLTKVHDGQSGYLSQSSHDLYFGLGEQTTVKSITVSWPSGSVQSVSPEKINQRLTINEE